MKKIISLICIVTLVVGTGTAFSLKNPNTKEVRTLEGEGITIEILEELNEKNENKEPEKPEITIPNGIEVDVLYFDLDRYLITATGEKIAPKITNAFIYEIKDYILNKTILESKDYKIECFRVLSEKKTEAEVLEPVSEIIAPGEYKVVMSLNSFPEKKGSRLITVLGKPQKLTSNKTKINVNLEEKELNLEVKTDGDSTGFTYTVLGESVKVDEKGKVSLIKPGQSTIIVKTTGDKVSHPAKLKIFITVEDKEAEAVLGEGDGEGEISKDETQGEASKSETSKSVGDKGETSKGVRTLEPPITIELLKAYEEARKKQSI